MFRLRRQSSKTELIFTCLCKSASQANFFHLRGQSYKTELVTSCLCKSAPQAEQNSDCGPDVRRLNCLCKSAPQAEMFKQIEDVRCNSAVPSQFTALSNNFKMRRPFSKAKIMQPSETWSQKCSFCPLHPQNQQRGFEDVWANIAVVRSKYRKVCKFVKWQVSKKANFTRSKCAPNLVNSY